MAAFLQDCLQLIRLVTDIDLGDDCDDETVGRAAYLFEGISLEEGDVSDSMRKLLSEESEDYNENDNNNSW